MLLRRTITENGLGLIFKHRFTNTSKMLSISLQKRSQDFRKHQGIIYS